jgi:hypothetical protein
MLSNKPHSNVGMVKDPKERLPNSAPRPWEDVTLSAQERYNSYKAVAEAKCRAIVLAMERPGITEAEQTQIRLDPASQFWYRELKQIRIETAEIFCERIDREFFIKASGRIEIFDGHKAVVSTLHVNSRQLDTLLSEGAFDQKRADQIAYAQKLGFRLATREESLAYAKDLLALEDQNRINEAGRDALEKYRKKRIRDSAGGVTIHGHDVHTFSSTWGGDAYPYGGALFVRACVKSK